MIAVSGVGVVLHLLIFRLLIVDPHSTLLQLKVALAQTALCLHL